MDHIEVDKLREWAGVTSIKDRHEDLLLRYYEKAIISENPVTKSMFLKYESFKKRNFLDQNLAVKSDGSINLDELNIIRTHNRNESKKEETHPTTLYKAPASIKEYVFDNFTVESERVT